MRRNPQRFLDAPSPLPTNLSFVLNIPPSVMTLGLGNMRRMLDELSHPEKVFGSVLVAGTNGKGSVTAYLSAILKNNGLRVGWYSSPHIYDVTERIQLDCAPVTLDEMESAASRVVPLYETIQFSYFEALTAIAFLVFAERGVDIAVLETGLGGRFDATNVVDPVACVLTSVGLDHRRILGDTREEILREKLGIARTGVPLLVSDLPDDLLAIIDERARADCIPLVTMEDIGTIELEQLTFATMRARIRTHREDYGVVRLPFLGRHQMSNALLALATAERLLDRVVNLDAAADDAFLEGRFQVGTYGHKRVILDVAHNDDALIAAAQTLAELSPAESNAMVLGMLGRKELDSFPRAMAQWLRRLYLVQPLPGDWLSAPWLLDRLGVANLQNRGLDVIMEGCFDVDDDWMRFIGGMLADTNPYGSLLVTGSHRTVELFGRRLRQLT